MAKMIPNIISEDTNSSAEKKLFGLLRDMPDTEDWYVLHSVGIARHPTQSQGECDFVVIIPNKGTFALEVKGGRISYESGIWYSIDRNNIQHIIKNPVVEANNAMHGLRDFVQKNDQFNSYLSLFGFGVVFPDSAVHGLFHIPDLDDYQIADIDDISNLKAYLLKLAGFWKSRKTPNVFIPNKQQAVNIVNVLRPEYDFKPSFASQIRSVERQIITLTENQKSVFEGLMDNSRCLVRGSAGTGKTVLAVECARSYAGQYQRIGLFCYNRMLASWLQENVRDDTSIVCDSFLDYMERAIQPINNSDIIRAKEENPKKFYSEALPLLYAEHLIETQQKPFDCIILDEAQDLFDSHYLEVIDLMIEGGIENGRWFFFMDSEQQNLYFANMTNEKVTELLKIYHCYYSSYTLFNNCRNSQAIIEKIDSIFGSHTKYRKMDTRGTDVVIRSYKQNSDQAEILEYVFKQLEKEQVDLDQIAILSAVRYEKSVASSLSIPISEDRNNRKGKALFSTVHSFKGLESPVVILTDFDRIDYEQRLNLLYVGMTRARSVLYMLVSDKALKTIDRRIREAL